MGRSQFPLESVVHQEAEERHGDQPTGNQVFTMVRSFRRSVRFVGFNDHLTMILLGQLKLMGLHGPCGCQERCEYHGVQDNTGCLNVHTPKYTRLPWLSQIVRPYQDFSPCYFSLRDERSRNLQGFPCK